MKDAAIIFSTSNTYLAQALAMYETLKKFNLEDRAWVVPLEVLESDAHQSLRHCFGERVTQTLTLPPQIKPSGNKAFLPSMVPKHQYYILIDTDIIILNEHFFEAFFNSIDHRVTLVTETFTYSEYLQKNRSLQRKKNPSRQFRVEYFPEIFGQPYLQTGAIGVCHETSAKILQLILDLIPRITTQTGDLPMWNYIAWKYPQLFRLIAPQHCLVMRPDGKGPSSYFHLPNITYEMGILKYQAHSVDALHYTSSRGHVVALEAYENGVLQSL